MAKAATQPKFESILDTPADQIERPKPLPAGSYETIVVEHRFDRSSQKQTEFVEFTLKVLNALDDVDENALAEYLTMPDGSRKTLTDATIRHTCYLVPKALFMLKDFCANCGIDTGAGTTPRGWIPETTNCQVGIFIRHKPWQNNEGVSANIERTFAVDS